MKKSITLLTSILVLAVQFAFAQADAPPPTTFVYKDFTLCTAPKDAEIFRISASGSEEKLGAGTLAVQLDKDEVYIIEVRRDGYQPVRKVYQRQKGGQEADTVILSTRIIQIDAFPPDAHIFVSGTDLGTSPQPLTLKRGAKVVVELKKTGFVTKNKTYYNQLGQEAPPINDNIKLDDRIVSLTAIPNTSVIMRDGKKAGTGTAEITIKRNDCAKISVEHEGFVSEAATYCNKDNEAAPPVTDEITLKDRQTVFTVTPADADIYIDGKKMATGSYTLKIPLGACREVTVRKSGFARYGITLCNQPDKTVTDPAYAVALEVDEAIKESDANSSNIANKRYTIPVKKSLKPDDAWKQLVSIINSRFDRFEKCDASSCYLTTDWVSSRILNQNSSYPQIVRTMIIVGLNSAKPLVYQITIKSEISKLDKECTGTLNKVPLVNRDECFEPFDYVLRSYYELISEIQSRLMEK